MTVVNAIHNLLVFIISLPLLIISPITKLVTSIIFVITMGFVHLILHLVRNILFFIPTLMFSKLYESGIPVVKYLTILGLPFSILGSVTGTLIGFGGETKATAFDLGFYATYPMSNTFNNYAKRDGYISSLMIGDEKLIFTVCENHGITNVINNYLE